MLSSILGFQGPEPWKKITYIDFPAGKLEKLWLTKKIRKDRTRGYKRWSVDSVVSDQGEHERKNEVVKSHNEKNRLVAKLEIDP